MHYIPLFVEIKTEACKDEGKERHEDSDSNRTAVGGAVGFRISEGNIFSHTQTWKKNITVSRSICEWRIFKILTKWNRNKHWENKWNEIIKRYVSSAGDDNDADDDDDADEDDHNDDKLETQQSVDKDENIMIVVIMITVTVIIL